MQRSSRSTIPKVAAELALIDRIRQRAQRSSGAVSLGIGDDCALLRARPGEEIAVTTDLSIEGRHFRRDLHPPEAVGHRAIARGLSDLAAMGARPLAAFLSLGLPPELTRPARRGAPAWSDRFLDGLLRLADQQKTPLAGGDLAECSMPLADIVLIGAVPRGKALLRSGARPGHSIYVTGSLGGSAFGLQLLNSGRKQSESELARHLWPQPRIQQGLWLRRRGATSAAIDISDGLSTDLHHLCQESGVSAEINQASLPTFPGASLDDALHGGEDYELLFTAPPGARLPHTIAGVPLTQVGTVKRHRGSAPRLVLVSSGKKQPLEPRGWEHFRPRKAKPE
ncbi:thiamine-phosphate kinase [Occallatibacter savannae]|uniref:thiamine-phosphate kinase n=1 Tax=Occallatibacter savannae TaxID=1002691 RepID=UPI001EF45281|nr:thiamine-phosphate kinase [Occallatibacter savannae]